MKDKLYGDVITSLKDEINNLRASVGNFFTTIEIQNNSLQIALDIIKKDRNSIQTFFNSLIAEITNSQYELEIIKEKLLILEPLKEDINIVQENLESIKNKNPQQFESISERLKQFFLNDVNASIWATALIRIIDKLSTM
ncbi:hypothetical protein JXQ31_05320 [candidate division KSB1 bacterium]|nr:hypothetical protein [candidate division KSB1 bacterium]